MAPERCGAAANLWRHLAGVGEGITAHFGCFGMIWGFGGCLRVSEEGGTRNEERGARNEGQGALSRGRPMCRPVCGGLNGARNEGERAFSRGRPMCRPVCGGLSFLGLRLEACEHRVITVGGGASCWTAAKRPPSTTSSSSMAGTGSTALFALSAQEPRPWRRPFGRQSELAQRNPMLLLRLLGVLLLRLAARRLLPSLFQLPPRMTRFEPLWLRSQRHSAPERAQSSRTAPNLHSRLRSAAGDPICSKQAVHDRPTQCHT